VAREGDLKDAEKRVGPAKGEFVKPPEVDAAEEQTPELPQQEEFWRPPVRFGSVPVEKFPLGCDTRQKFFKFFPYVSLPLQVVERVTFGHPELEPNRLFWGDNLHVMRQLPPESIDLIYIDPPFFSGRTYNVIFGDQNELRSFSDIWEGGMPGYLIWLNARLFEMKRLLKKTGSIVVHLDWHAAHYVKVELDKLFGPDCFRNEIIWFADTGGRASRFFPRKHYSMFWYSRSTEGWFFSDAEVQGAPRNQCCTCRTTLDKWNNLKKHVDKDGRIFRTIKSAGKVYKYYDDEPVLPTDVWSDLWLDINNLQQKDPERIGYPTQKPEALLGRVIVALSPIGGVVADFFGGGGTTAAAAQRHGRRWLTCDQSRVAVAITADRVSKLIEEEVGRLFPVPDFAIEHWGVYEAERLSKMPPDQFREFVVRAFGAVPDEAQPNIHGMKGAVPVWVGEPSQRAAVTAKEVEAFANAIRRTLRYKQDNLRDGIMLAWAFRPDATKAAERLREMEKVDLNFIRLEQVRIDSERFREHVVALSTEKADYQNFLTFVQPPKVEVGWKRLTHRTYILDVSDTAVLNVGARIINVQWDFEYGKRFTSTPGYSFIRGAKKEPALQAQYEFPRTGKFRIACKVQDDLGGEGLWVGEIDVT